MFFLTAPQLYLRLLLISLAVPSYTSAAAAVMILSRKLCRIEFSKHSVTLERGIIRRRV
jgi:hypothetical protein